VRVDVIITTDRSSADRAIQYLEARLSPVGLVTFLSTVVDPFIRNRIQQRFAGEGDDVVGAWHPLSVATQQIRASYGFPPSHPINVRTGKLESWLVGAKSDVKQFGIGASLEHPPPGSDAILSKKLSTAQSGSSSPVTPARPVIGVNENDLLFVTSSLVAWLSQDMI
jgi:hypothetical protein